MVGLDVSTGMIAEAQRRAAGIANATFAVTDGTALPRQPADSLDLVLAADVFPYLVQAGPPVPADHMRDFARVLRIDGRIIILNLSYRDDPAADLSDARRWAEDNGLALEQAGARPFRLWDATAFVAHLSPRAGRT